MPSKRRKFVLTPICPHISVDLEELKKMNYVGGKPTEIECVKCKQSYPFPV